MRLPLTLMIIIFLIIHVCDHAVEMMSKQRKFSLLSLAVFLPPVIRTEPRWNATSHWFWTAVLTLLYHHKSDCLIFLDHRCCSWQPEPNLADHSFLMLRSCWFPLVSQFFTVIQWTQLDEKYMYRVMLHKAVKPDTRMMKTSWAQRQSFNFCSRRLLLAISCSTWEYMRTDEDMKKKKLGCIHSLWAGTNLPVELSVTRIRCIPVAVPLHHFTPLSENEELFLYTRWRCRRPLHAQRIAIRKGHLEMFPPSSPLLHSEVLPQLERILDSSGGAALLCCSHEEEILSSII